MKVSKLSDVNDWRFGKGKADYSDKTAAIQQNVLTRLRSFTSDWFADIGAGVPWIDTLGTKDNEAIILREIEATVLATEGVRTIERLSIIRVDDDRGAFIELIFKDIFDKRYDNKVSLP